MKKFLVLLFLIAIGASVYGQELESSSYSFSGYVSADMGAGQYYTEDGVLYLKSSPSSTGTFQYTFLVKYPASKQNTSFTIPTGTTRICRGAFQGNKYIQTIRIPSTVRRIGDNTFDGCENLRSIEVYTSSSSIQVIEEDRETEKEEIGRYNINGVKVEETDDGVQIILYSDGTADKILKP